MVINLENKIGNTSSNDDGLKLLYFLEIAVKNKEHVIIEINPNLPMSSSFLNTSFGFFLDKYGKDLFFKTVKFKGSKKQFERISNYLINYIDTYNIH